MWPSIKKRTIVFFHYHHHPLGGGDNEKKFVCPRSVGFYGVVCNEVRV